MSRKIEEVEVLHTMCVATISEGTGTYTTVPDPDPDMLAFSNPFSPEPGGKSVRATQVDR